MAIVTNLVAYWPLTEPTAAARDDAFSTEHLTNNNSVAKIAGPATPMNYVSAFTAASSMYCSRADDAALSVGAGDFSFSLWAYLTSKPANFMGILSKDPADGANREYQIGWRNDTDRLYAAVLHNGGNTSILLSDSVLGAPALATWYHIVVTWDNTAHSLAIYINNGAGNTSTNAAVTPADKAAAFEIGRTNNGLYWNGRIAHVAMWKRLLTATERGQLYNGGVGWGNILDIDFAGKGPLVGGRLAL